MHASINVSGSKIQIVEAGIQLQLKWPSDPLKMHSLIFEPPQTQDVYGDTALHDCAKFGHTEVARQLVVLGKTDINIRCTSSPLCCCCCCCC
jgi:ankyrin repeat protein